MKKEIWILIILGIIIVVLLGFLAFVPAKQKSAPAQVGIAITSPKLNEEVSFPIKISGVIIGNGWSGFEGQAGRVDLISDDGLVIGSSALKTTSDWTSLPTGFEATIVCVATPCNWQGNAQLYFHNENPSGMPEKDKTSVLPIKIK